MDEVMTVFLTVYSYVPASPSTVVSVVRVTSTPVIVSTVEAIVNPTRTMTSVFTNFVTITNVVTYWQSITHVSVIHSVSNFKSFLILMFL